MTLETDKNTVSEDDDKPRKIREERERKVARNKLKATTGFIGEVCATPEFVGETLPSLPTWCSKFAQ